MSVFSVMTAPWGRQKRPNPKKIRSEMSNGRQGDALVGPKTENVEKVWVLPLLFEGSRAAGGRQPNERGSGPDRLGGGRGRVNPPPCGLV